MISKEDYSCVVKWKMQNIFPDIKSCAHFEFSEMIKLKEYIIHFQIINHNFPNKLQNATAMVFYCVSNIFSKKFCEDVNNMFLNNANIFVKTCEQEIKPSMFIFPLYHSNSQSIWWLSIWLQQLQCTEISILVLSHQLRLWPDISLLNWNLWLIKVPLEFFLWDDGPKHSQVPL